jgi:hypothetical protein
MPELRTDYLAGMTDSYMRGKKQVSDLESANLRRRGIEQAMKFNKAKLDEFYREKDFQEGFAGYYEEAKKRNKDITVEAAGEEYSISKGRLDAAHQFREMGFKKKQEQRMRLSTFTELIGKLWTQGAQMGDPKAFLTQMVPQIKQQFPEFDNYDLDAIKEVDDNGWLSFVPTDKKGKELGTLLSHPSGKSFWVPKTTEKYTVIDYPIVKDGKKKLMAMGPGGKRITLGDWTDEMGDGGTKDDPAQVKTWQWMMKNLGITEAQLKQFILSGKTKTDREIAMDVWKKIAGSDLGPIDWDRALRDPKSDEGKKAAALLSVIEEAVGGMRPEVEKSETSGVPEGVPPGSIPGTYNGKPAWRAPDGKIYVEE